LSPGPKIPTAQRACGAALGERAMPRGVRRWWSVTFLIAGTGMLAGLVILWPALARGP